jgi:hypothetical protein
MGVSARAKRQYGNGSRGDAGLAVNAEELRNSCTPVSKASYCPTGKSLPLFAT